ncbi:hypothetical protein C5167_031748 [Papaver somniferum]|uniref:Uncharacterized protein n=1 Tax=Papaver somniferum TaxID=3469 RepID=A0A4Y7K915_PAPSO|nr:hypothetical protein C5167_031748 [Papaver somniferum]
MIILPVSFIGRRGRKKTVEMKLTLYSFSTVDEVIRKVMLNLDMSMKLMNNKRMIYGEESYGREQRMNYA